MALFDTPPKSDPRFLYGREKELSSLSKHIENKDWVILLGPRRIGKTSLAKCTITELGYKSLFLDARGDNNFRKSLLSSLLQSESSLRLKAGLKIPNTPINIGMEYTKTFLKENLDRLLQKTSRLVILVDEAQWFGNPKGVVMLLAHIYDYYYDKVTFIITGSAIGVTKSILEPGPKSPLYGRAISKMEVGKWGSQVSLDFIRKGCKEKGLACGEELVLEAEKRLDGIPGWLTLFGHNYADTGDYEKAIRQTTKEAYKILEDELESISRSGLGVAKQLEILKMLAKTPELYKKISLSTGFNGNTLSRHLDTLQRLGYIERNSENQYFISDPLLRSYLKEKG